MDTALLTNGCRHVCWCRWRRQRRSWCQLTAVGSAADGGALGHSSLRRRQCRQWIECYHVCSCIEAPPVVPSSGSGSARSFGAGGMAGVSMLCSDGACVTSTRKSRMSSPAMVVSVELPTLVLLKPVGLYPGVDGCTGRRWWAQSLTVGSAASGGARGRSSPHQRQCRQRIG